MKWLEVWRAVRDLKRALRELKRNPKFNWTAAMEHFRQMPGMDAVVRPLNRLRELL